MKYFIFFFFFTLSYTNAQTDSIIISDIKNFINVSADYYTSPIRYDSKDWIKLSATIGITAIATVADKEIRNFSQSHRSEFANSIFKIDDYYPPFVVISTAALYGYGLLAENSKIRNLSVKLAEATLLSTSITFVTKTIIGRARPFANESQYYFIPFTFDNDYNSFPSGHTTLAFAYSTVLANEIDNVFWKAGWYSFAGLVGYSRIYNNQHWFSDVLMGMAIGYFSGEFVNHHTTNTENEISLSLYPLPMGIAIQIVF